MNEMKTVLGIELGSTRIKAVAINENHVPVSSGDYTWKSSYENGVWTYDLAEVWKGLKAAVSGVENRESIQAMGVSAMMHGYLAFDKDWNLLEPFRTWQNTITGQAAAELTEAFHFNVPQRWSISHLYQAVLNGEEHVPQIAHITTLAGYIHYMLTGVNALGVGEASGMFPIDSEKNCYDEAMIARFNEIVAARNLPWKLIDILPSVLVAGDKAGALTESGAAMLDGLLPVGIPFAPAEGDAGTGMTATNAVAPRTGNVSAGTSDFAMIVTDHALGVHPEIDMVTTPAGLPVAMVHCNNCTSDINAWVALFAEFAAVIGSDIDRNTLFTTLFRKALEGDADCGGLLSYNYFSGEGVTALDEGRPVFLRTPDAHFSLANFMRTHLLSALATLKIGLDILTQEESVPVDKLYGHGGFFKTPEVGQRLLSAAVGAPVSVMETAGEGGPYGMALLCAYMLWKQPGETLEDYLDNKVFAGASGSTLCADAQDIAGFNAFLTRYKNAFPVEKAAVEGI